MENRRYGYARVSSITQNEDRQVEQLLADGIDERDIYVDKKSGKDFDREKYQLLAGSLLREGDTLVICSIDRLGRNYNEIREQWRILTKECGVYMKVLDMPLLDTSAQAGDLDSTFISDLVLNILSYVANKERDYIKKRQREGINVAIKNGVTFGRPKAEYPENWDEVYEEWTAGNITAKAAMERLGLKRTTFYKLVGQK